MYAILLTQQFLCIIHLMKIAKTKEFPQPSQSTNMDILCPQVLLYEADGSETYANDLRQFLQKWFPGGSMPYTPKGLAWGAQWGPNRYAGGLTSAQCISDHFLTFYKI